MMASKTLSLNWFPAWMIKRKISVYTVLPVMRSKFHCTETRITFTYSCVMQRIYSGSCHEEHLSPQHLQPPKPSPHAESKGVGLCNRLCVSWCQETGSRWQNDKKRWGGSNFLRKLWGGPGPSGRKNMSHQRHQQSGTTGLAQQRSQPTIWLELLALGTARDIRKD